MNRQTGNLFFIFSCFFFANVSYAGQFVGNGGLILRCNASTDRQQVQLLDTYEATELRGLKIDLGDDTLSETDKAVLAFKRLSKLDPERSKRFAKRAVNFFKETVIVKGIPLAPSEDAGKVVLPVGCDIQQAAVQMKPDFSGDPVFVIDQERWEAMTKNDRASLIVHEVIFNELLTEGRVKNSASTRYWNGALITNSLDRFKNIETYAQALKDSGFTSYNLVPFSLLKSFSYDKFSKNYLVNCLGANPRSYSSLEVKSNAFCSHLSRPVRSLSVGNSHSCAVENGKLWCWGSNKYGQLDVPKLRDPYLVTVSDVTSCAADADGLKCWGQSNSPKEPKMKDITNLKSNRGSDYCASNAEGVQCWGNGGFGTIATPLTSGKITSLAVSGDGACAMEDDGYPSCTSHASSSTAFDPPKLDPTTVLAGAGSGYCGLQKTALVCWGNKDWSNWFDKSTSPLKNVTQFSMGTWQSCAVNDGTLGCWGYASSPRAWQNPPDLKNVYLLSVGDASACAATPVGIKCWGANDNGEASPY
jgi:hypothetical protein